MKKINIIWIFTCIYLFLGITIPLFISVFGVKNRLDSSVTFQNRFIDISNKQTLTQKFTVNHDYLNIIILTLKNPALVNTGDYLFSIKDSEGKTLAEQTFSGYNVGDPSNIRFQFDPIAFSKGKTFYFELKSLGSYNPMISVAANDNEGLNYTAYFKSINKKIAIVDYFQGIFKLLLSNIIFFIFWVTLIISVLIFAIKIKIKS